MDKKVRVNQTEFIGRIKKHLSTEDVKYLYDLCFTHGFKGVIYEATRNKNAPEMFDFQFAVSENKIEKIKSKCNRKRFISMSLYAIWIIHYSGLLMQLDQVEKEENYSIIKMFELGETFFYIKDIPIIYWPFEGANPFENRFEADKLQVNKMPKILDGELNT